jgi:hypothetical protein
MLVRICLKPPAIAARSSSENVSPEICSAAAIISLVMSGPGCCCACAQRTPGKSVVPRPMELK